MKCPRCQAENDAGARFCEDCGARLEAACPSCGTPITPGKKFCRSCGAPLTPEPAGRFASPESYTPKHLAEKILTSKAALEGERKQVTVLFADMKGSMELLADRDPEEARRILDPVLELMMEAVHRYEGTVNQVMGDGIMALFGAPVAHEDHAVRACYAALRMQESVKKYATEARRSHAAVVKIRVGLNSGEVVVRAIGSDLRMDYTAVGQTTHLAARMEQMARASSTLLTAETVRLAEGYVEVRPLGPVAVRGLGEAIDVYELTGAAPVRRRFEATAMRELTRFVGRRAELQQLLHARDLAASGRGQIVAVVGQPGVGKSRLLFEFTHSDVTAGCLVLETGAVSYGTATPYLAIIDLLRRYFGLHGPGDPREVREKVVAKVLALDRLLEPTTPALLALLDAPGDDGGWRALEPSQRGQRILEAVRRVLLRESQVQPLVVVVEDLQWIDSETQAVLDTLVESLPAARMLLLVNYRPEYRHSWTGKSYYTQLRLDPLSPESAEDLLDALLGADATVAPLKRLLIERTEGNPFFLEESVRTLVETHALVGQHGARRLARALDRIRVPATVQAVLAARIDRLPPTDKSLLQTAAVVGKDVPLALLRAVADCPEHEIRETLGRLQTAEFLYETRLFPDLEYGFRHALTHEVAYGSLLQERRRALHAAIVGAIEALYQSALDGHVEDLGQHAARGELWEKATTYLRQAGVKAMNRSAYREAVTLFEQALAAATHAPATPAVLDQVFDLRLSLRTSLTALAQLASSLEQLREAEALARRLGDDRRLARVLCLTANGYYLVGRHRQSLEAARGALALAESLGDARLRAVASLYIGQTSYLAGDLGAAAASLTRSIELFEAAGSHEHLGVVGLPIAARSMLAWTLSMFGRFPEAVAHGEEAVRLARTLDRPSSLVVAYIGLVIPHLFGGQIRDAIEAAESAFTVCRGADLPLFRPMALSQLGYAYALAGRTAEALPMLEEAAREWEAIGLRGGLSIVLRFLGEAYQLSGRRDDALRMTGRSLATAREHDEALEQARALLVLGRILSAPDPPDADGAETAFRSSLALAEPRRDRVCVALCHAGLAALFRRLGKRPDAEAHCATATTMYREMGMTYWLDRAEAGLK